MREDYESKLKEVEQMMDIVDKTSKDVELRNRRKKQPRVVLEDEDAMSPEGYSPGSKANRIN